MSLGADFGGILTAAQDGADWALTSLYQDLHPSVLRYLRAHDPAEAEMMRAKHQRIIHCAGDHPTPTFREAAEADDVAVHVDLGFSFGDACTPIDGYPMRVFPPSAVMQLTTVGAIDAGVRATP